MKKEKKLNATEAIYGFCGWLTTRNKKTVMSSKHNAAVIADLIVKFIETNNLPEPRMGWGDNLIHPRD